MPDGGPISVEPGPAIVFAALLTARMRERNGPATDLPVRYEGTGKGSLQRVSRRFGRVV
ncbi:hypothetical protein RRSWK_05723 [Rhodopirellula sp. SWK7]|nr:hypothetical protein RRSWK_05723 [Rhodopirellula sp. SWK7]